GGFPLPGDPLLSASIVTNCGKFYAAYCFGHHKEYVFPKEHGFEITRVKNSSQIVEWVINWLSINNPDFVFIHNEYGFDIPRLSVHCPPHLRRVFQTIRIGTVSEVMGLAIEGVTIVDTFSYINKLHRQDYSSVSLDFISKSLGLPGKKNAPSMDFDPNLNPDMTEVLKYNIFDSYLHYQIAIKGGLIEEIMLMCSTFKSPLNDVAKFISGTMTVSLLSSFALSKGNILDWSQDPCTDQIKGALVLNPIKGIHKNVETYDFSSLYPSIMIGCNISAETVSEVYDVNI
ncbi:hypothetical protein HMI56_005487, partial [Coelomomyces lativittatus]